MNLSEFDYNLPKKLIAQFPQEKRDESRLLVLDRSTGAITHKRFFEITEYLKKGDVLVLNNTRVIPARLYGKKTSGGIVEVFLLEQLDKERITHHASRIQIWKCLIGNSKGIKPAKEIIPSLLPSPQRGEGSFLYPLPAGERIEVRGQNEIYFEHDLKAKILEKNEDESWLIEFSAKGDINEAINKIGIMPLPPYIKRVMGQGARVKEIDKERYQTVFAKKDGAVAAPTAGLHFTDELLAKIRAIGVEIQYITLHTGWGTFKPVKVDDITKHKMPEEYYEIAPEVFNSIKNAKEDGRRIIAVGSTSLRTIEACVKNGWDNPILKGCTNLFIYPGFNFKVVDAMATNFHLPKSTLLMLVCAFAGRDFIMKAYKEAIENNYRFFSYGDAMMIA